MTNTDLANEILALQKSIRRQRIALGFLTAVVVGGYLAGAYALPADAQFETVTCRAIKVLDQGGTVRVGVFTTPSTSGITWFDKNGKMRIHADTTADGRALVQLSDPNEKARIALGTFSDSQGSFQMFDGKDIARLSAVCSTEGPSMLTWKDSAGKTRIGIRTAPDGFAGIGLFDASERPRIGAATSASGEVVLPTKDMKR